MRGNDAAGHQDAEHKRAPVGTNTNPTPTAPQQSKDLFFMILVTLFLALGVLVVGLISSHMHGGSMHDSSIRSWLQQHPPRKVSHDAELLRRRVLADFTERPPEELSEHVPSILASLDRE
jgi:hypothetical protein